jgi:hypothetical protein
MVAENGYNMIPLISFLYLFAQVALMALQQTFKIQFMDEQGRELFQIYRNYVGTVEGLRLMVLDEIERGEHGQRVVDARVIQTSGKRNL